MVFRVTQFQNDQQFLITNREAREDEARILERLSTLKRVNRPSDQPADYNRIQDAKTDMAETERYLSTIESTLARFQVVEDALGNIRDSLDEARGLALRGTSQLHDDLERETIADELEQLRLNIFNRLNSRHEGRYIFSGTAVDTEPFQNTATGAYSGNTDGHFVRLSPTDQININFPGSDIAFGAGGQGSADGLLDALDDLVVAYRANNIPTIEAELPRLRPILERINETISEVSTRSARMVSMVN